MPWWSFTPKVSNQETKKPFRMPTTNSPTSKSSTAGQQSIQAPLIPASPTMAPLGSRRSTLSVPRAYQVRPRSKNETCTHLNMTRFFCKDFRCSVCLRPGSFGWLYRCTQDRELLLQEDCDQAWAASNLDRLDNLWEIFDDPEEPPKRGPLARMDKDAFLKEMTAEERAQYTDEQIEIIRKQRLNVLEVAQRSVAFTPLPTSNALFGGLQSSGGFERALEAKQKPWFPLRGGECQFKCCHNCRPSLRDRSWLPLNGIVDDDLPFTAVTGFGFNMVGKRPVMPAEVVKNLGLRPTPTIKANSQTIPAPPPLSPMKKQRRAIVRLPASHNLNMGLGLVSSSTSSTSETALTPLVTFPTTLPISPNATTPEVEVLLPLLTSSPTSRRHSISLPPTPNISFLAAPPAESFTEKDPQDHIQPSFMVREGAQSRHGFRNDDEDGFDKELEVQSRDITDLFSKDDEEMSGEVEEIVTDAGILPLTTMEQHELEGHHFGEEPLEVKGGVAVLEESVELHVPDLITQF